MRYIHDILKVDVIVKSALMDRIRDDVLQGNLDGDDYLTARFGIPNVWVTGEARLTMNVSARCPSCDASGRKVHFAGSQNDVQYDFLLSWE